MAEEISCSRHCKGYGLELSKNFVPLADTDALLMDGDGGKNLQQPINPILQEAYGHIHGVNDPTQHLLGSDPRAIPLLKYLE